MHTHSHRGEQAQTQTLTHSLTLTDTSIPHAEASTSVRKFALSVMHCVCLLSGCFHFFAPCVVFKSAATFQTTQSPSSQTVDPSNRASR